MNRALGTSCASVCGQWQTEGRTIVARHHDTYRTDGGDGNGDDARSCGPSGADDGPRSW